MVTYSTVKTGLQGGLRIILILLNPIKKWNEIRLQNIYDHLENDVSLNPIGNSRLLPGLPANPCWISRLITIEQIV